METTLAYWLDSGEISRVAALTWLILALSLSPPGA
jgi:hypothetical protein